MIQSEKDSRVSIDLPEIEFDLSQFLCFISINSVYFIHETKAKKNVSGCKCIECCGTRCMHFLLIRPSFVLRFKQKKREVVEKNMQVLKTPTRSSSNTHTNIRMHCIGFKLTQLPTNNTQTHKQACV